MTSAPCDSESIIPSTQCLGSGDGGAGLESCFAELDMGRLESWVLSLARWYISSLSRLVFSWWWCASLLTEPSWCPIDLEAGAEVTRADGSLRSPLSPSPGNIAVGWWTVEVVGRGTEEIIGGDGGPFVGV